jgi:hypothetical protein
MLILHKHSTIHCTKSAMNQCKEVGFKDYNYELDVLAKEKLDRDGFIIDHSALHEEVKAQFDERVGSCEQLCIRCADAIERILTLHGSAWRQIHFKLKPVDSNAWVEIKRVFKKEYHKQTTYPEIA